MLFRSVNSVVEENENIVEVLWQKDDNYKLLDSREQRYDFNIKAESNAINHALYQDALLYPYDLNGNSRIADNAPDAGCYEYISEEL